MKNIPIYAAEQIAKKYDYDQVIIIARKVGEDGGEHCTTYGVNAANCSVASKIGAYLTSKIMGWPEGK